MDIWRDKIIIFEDESREISPKLAYTVVSMVAIFCALIIFIKSEETKVASAFNESFNQTVQNTQLYRKALKIRSSNAEAMAEEKQTDWLDYKNFKYGYQIKYPRNWFVYGFSDLKDVYIQPSDEKNNDSSTPHEISLRIQVVPFSGAGDIDKALGKLMANELQGGRRINKENMVIGGEDGYSVMHCGKFECWSGKWAVVKNNYLYFMDSRGALMPEFEKIKNTFDFIN